MATWRKHHGTPHGQVMFSTFPPKVSGTHNGGILYLMLGCFGGGVLKKPYPYSLLWVRIPPFWVLANLEVPNFTTVDPKQFPLCRLKKQGAKQGPGDKTGRQAQEGGRKGVNLKPFLTRPTRILRGRKQSPWLLTTYPSIMG